MRKIRVGIKMDLKLLGAHYKRIVLFTLQMVVLCLAIGVAGSHVLYADHSVEPFNLAIVDREHSKWTKMIIGTIEQMETVTKLCKIQVLQEEEAKESLERGEVTAILTIPEHFVEDVMCGVNTPLTLNKPDSTLLEGVVADEIIKAGAKLLSAAQAGIYSALDAYREYGIDEGKSYDELMREINLIFAKDMLSRTEMFQEKEVVSTKFVSPLEYYILSGFIVMLILSLMLVMDVVELLNKSENLMRYRVAKVRASSLIVGKLMSLSLFLLVLVLVILGSVALLASLFSLEMNWQLSLQAVVGILLMIISLSSFGMLIGLLFGGKDTYGLLLFVLAIVMAFLSGGIIPNAYMPPSISNLGYFTYNKYALMLLMPLFGASCEGLIYIVSILFTFICMGISVVILKKRGLRI